VDGEVKRSKPIAEAPATAPIVDSPVALSSGIVLIHVKVGPPSYETVVHEIWQ
jgi:hypothetical protein